MVIDGQRIEQFLAALNECTDFEAAGTVTLESLLSLTRSRLEGGHSGARILRAVAHVRRGDSYRSVLFVSARESEAKAPESHLEANDLVPSASAWQWIERHRCPVSIDVFLSTVHAHGPNVLQKVVQGPLDGRETRQRLLGRSATHVFVLPMRAPGGNVAGMIAVEAQSREAIGQDMGWSTCREAAQALVDIATPYLCQLPAKQPPSVAVDQYLPVIGNRMAPLVEMLRIFARQQETLLLSGPTGAGKSRLARWCHEQSLQRSGPFESLSLLNTPEELQIAELFGWKRGAFTGAVKDTEGHLGRAAGGTLFIDEIDKLSIRAQSALLRVVEERMFRPLGDGASERRTDVRFIVGTNVDLAAAVRRGAFREDLYYRVNVLPFRVPGLDERSDEIGGWARYMLSRRHAESRRGEATLDASTERRLASQSWPGNLRQLDNIIRRAYAISTADTPNPAENLSLTPRHVDAALSYEASQPPALSHAMLQAAEAFVGELENPRAAAANFGLDWADTFRGFVLAVAINRYGRDEAFRRLGKESLIVGRNHYKTYRREISRLRSLHVELGLPWPPPFVVLPGDD